MYICGVNVVLIIVIMFKNYNWLKPALEILKIVVAFLAGGELLN